MTEQPVFREKSPRRRLVLLVIALGVLAYAGWLWWQPRTMCLVARVSCFLYFDVPFPGYSTGFLVYERPATSGRWLCKSTFIDWEGRPRWQVNFLWHTPPKGSADECGSRVARSPDGRVLAVSVPNGKMMRITSWRDGRLLGTADVPWSPPPVIPRPGLAVGTHLLATDSGRVWLYSTGRATCRLAAVDGAHAAIGAEMVNPTSTAWGFFYDLSPDGQVLLDAIPTIPSFMPRCRRRTPG